jgi:lipopolysaccharide transport system permease protein
VSSAAAHESQVTVIEPPKGASWPDWRELWSHRELLAVLARRDVSVRYKQSFMGALWSLVQPLSFAAVFSIFFDLLADIDTGTDVPYPVFAVLGMVTWLFFTGALVKVSESTVASATLISKVYFPRLVIPLAAVAAPTVDFVVGMVVALAVTLAYGVIPPVQVVLVPLMIPLVLAVTLGFGLWFDGLNPMVCVLELMRWMVLPGADFPTLLIFVPLVESAFLIATGVLYFGRAQQSFADVI